MTRKRVAPKQEMLQVRIHKNIRTRAELLLEWVAGNAELSPSGSAELTDVYRAALCLGLERLESKRRRELNENPARPKDQAEEVEEATEDDEPIPESLKFADRVIGLIHEGAQMEADRAAIARTELHRRYRYTAIHPVDDVLKQLIENPDPPEDLVENPDPSEDQAEEVDPRQGLSTFQRQLLKMKEAEERKKLEEEES